MSVFEAMVASSFRFLKAWEVVCASIVDDGEAFQGKCGANLAGDLNGTRPLWRRMPEAVRLVGHIEMYN